MRDPVVGRRVLGFAVGEERCRWHSGQRGSQKTTHLAIPNRTVMNESKKWRSGREWLRVVSSLPSRRGGKPPSLLGGNERIDAQGDTDVMVPSWETTPLEVVQTQLTFEVFVDALRAPALLDGPDQLLHGDLPRQRPEVVLGRGILALWPLNDKPHVLADRGIVAIIMERDDATPREVGPEFLFGPFSPGHATEPLPANGHGQIANAQSWSPTAKEPVEAPDLGLWVNSNGVVQPQVPELRAESR